MFRNFSKFDKATGLKSKQRTRLSHRLSGGRQITTLYDPSDGTEFFTGTRRECQNFIDETLRKIK